MKAHTKLTSEWQGIGASFAKTRFEVLSGKVIQEYKEIAKRSLFLHARLFECTTR